MSTCVEAWRVGEKQRRHPAAGTGYQARSQTRLVEKLLPEGWGFPRQNISSSRPSVPR